MDSLKAAIVKHMASVKAKMHNQGGGHLQHLGSPLSEQDKDKSDRAPELEGSPQEEAMETPQMEQAEMMKHPDHMPAGPHLMARTGGGLSPDEHAKVIQALAQASAHPGRGPISLGEHAADGAKAKFASMNKAKHKIG